MLNFIKSKSVPLLFNVPLSGVSSEIAAALKGETTRWYWTQGPGVEVSKRLPSSSQYFQTPHDAVLWYALTNTTINFPDEDYYTKLQLTRALFNEYMSLYPDYEVQELVWIPEYFKMWFPWLTKFSQDYNYNVYQEGGVKVEDVIYAQMVANVRSGKDMSIPALAALSGSYANLVMPQSWVNFCKDGRGVFLDTGKSLPKLNPLIPSQKEKMNQWYVEWYTHDTIDGGKRLSNATKRLIVNYGAYSRLMERALDDGRNVADLASRGLLSSSFLVDTLAVFGVGLMNLGWGVDTILSSLAGWLGLDASKDRERDLWEKTYNTWRLTPELAARKLKYPGNIYLDLFNKVKTGEFLGGFVAKYAGGDSILTARSIQQIGKVVLGNLLYYLPLVLVSTGVGGFSGVGKLTKQGLERAILMGLGVWGSAYNSVRSQVLLTGSESSVYNVYFPIVAASIEAVIEMIGGEVLVGRLIPSAVGGCLRRYLVAFGGEGFEGVSSAVFTDLGERLLRGEAADTATVLELVDAFLLEGIAGLGTQVALSQGRNAVASVKWVSKRVSPTVVAAYQATRSSLAKGSAFNPSSYGEFSSRDESSVLNLLKERYPNRAENTLRWYSKRIAQVMSGARTLEDVVSEDIEAETSTVVNKPATTMLLVQYFNEILLLEKEMLGRRQISSSVFEGEGVSDNLIFPEGPAEGPTEGHFEPPSETEGPVSLFSTKDYGGESFSVSNEQVPLVEPISHYPVEGSLAMSPSVVFTPPPILPVEAFPGEVSSGSMPEVLQGFGTYQSSYGTELVSKGIVMAANVGDRVCSLSSGKVVYAQSSPGNGKMAIVQNGKKFYIYSHMSSLNVSVGQLVEKGSVLGVVNENNLDYGVPVVGFQYREGKVAIDPFQVSGLDLQNILMSAEPAEPLTIPVFPEVAPIEFPEVEMPLAESAPEEIPFYRYFGSPPRSGDEYRFGFGEVIPNLEPILAPGLGAPFEGPTGVSTEVPPNVPTQVIPPYYPSDKPLGPRKRFGRRLPPGEEVVVPEAVPHLYGDADVEYGYITPTVVGGESLTWEAWEKKYIPEIKKEVEEEQLSDRVEVKESPVVIEEFIEDRELLNLILGEL